MRYSSDHACLLDPGGGAGGGAWLVTEAILVPVKQCMLRYQCLDSSCVDFSCHISLRTVGIYAGSVGYHRSELRAVRQFCGIISFVMFRERSSEEAFC